MDALLNASTRQRTTPHKQSTPLDKDQCLVTTPYGRGCVIRSRPDGCYEVQLLEWNMSSPKQPYAILYTHTKQLSFRPMVGDDVICAFGRGRVKALRDKNMVHVELYSWRLAGRSMVQCYLRVRQVQVVRKRTIEEMSDPYERVVHAQELKVKASKLFSNKDYTQALTVYAQAVDAVRYVQHTPTSSNELRADLVTVMITCCNNAGTCSIQAKQWEQAQKFAKNALVLIDALYEKRGLRIHSILQRELGDAKLFGEWKVKSLLIMARGMLEQGKYADALQQLKQAQDDITTYISSTETPKKSIAHLQSQEKEVKRLRASCIQRKKADKKKEKQRAMAMFASPEKKETSPKSVIRPSPEDNGNKSTSETKKATSGSDEELDELPQRTRPSPVKKSVSFSEDTKAGAKEIVHARSEEDDEQEEQGVWYEEHKEALILSAVVGLAAFSVALLRSRK